MNEVAIAAMLRLLSSNLACQTSETRRELDQHPKAAQTPKLGCRVRFRTMSWWEERPINSPQPAQPTTNGVSFTQLRTYAVMLPFAYILLLRHSSPILRRKGARGGMLACRQSDLTLFVTETSPTTSACVTCNL